MTYKEFSLKIMESIKMTGYFQIRHVLSGEKICSNARIAKLGQLRSDYLDSDWSGFTGFKHISLDRYISNKTRY